LRIKLRGPLISAQIALALPLVIAAILTVRSLERLVRVDVGFEPTQVLSMYVKMSDVHCAKFSLCIGAIGEIVERVRAIPGVRNVAVAGTRPLSSGLSLPIAAGQDLSSTAQEAVVAEFQIVTPEYFATLGIPLRGGRSFDARDAAGGQLVTIVNESLARLKFDGAAVGKHLNLAPAGRRVALEIVGVAADVRDVSPRTAAQPTFYVPLAQSNLLPRTSLLVRAATDPLQLASPIRQAIWSVDKNAPVTDVRTLDGVLDDAVASSRFQTGLFFVFGTLAILLAVLGVFGLISYTVSGRMHEFGIRLALGAQSTDIVRLIMVESASAVGWGIALGVVLSLASGRFLQSLLFEIQSTDVATLVLVAVVLGIVGVMTYYLPARRAMRADPLVVLRSE
jgi:putative ABC transport system permease protein